MPAPPKANLTVQLTLGICECGCGEATKIARWTNRRDNRARGEPLRFVHGHNVRGKHPPNWKGGYQTVYGYVLAWVDGRRDYEHRVVMAKQLGRPLRAEEHVHHINGDKADNRPENLMLFASNAEHQLYHQRQKRQTGGIHGCSA